ncbi:aldose 1-epimerase family protein [Caproiciproducens sp. NJN-50]|uniref:aldose 1-epimerase family protein n=1 Tax=Caproiciproducens sp. NJN-50 TaxID=2507162 RepID=UPI0013E8D332|nr:aldose 1-epimerase family protein [Caproiciproducens sp. NJN-50]
MVTIENEFYRVEVNPLGSELWSVVEKSSGHEFLWQGKEEKESVWPRRAPILFPVCGRLRGGAARIDGKRYSIPMHGFARDYEHQVSDLKKDRVTFCFSDSPETKIMYPFSFTLYTSYILEGKILRCRYEVENHGGAGMPFSIGYHTGYRLPLSDHSNARDCTLVFEKEETITRLPQEDGFLTGKTEPFLQNERNVGLFASCFPGTCILENFRSRSLELQDRRAGKSIQVGIAGFPYLAIWISHEARPFVCIEPWYGIPDEKEAEGDFRRKKGIVALDGGKTFSCEQTIEIKG